MSPRPTPIPTGGSPPARLALALACACLPTSLFAADGPCIQDPPAQDPPAQNPAAGGDTPAAAAPATGSARWLRGYLASRLYTRWTGDDSDTDLYETLSLDFGDSNKDAVTGHFMGRLTYDFDGADDTFSSLNDTYGGRLDGLVYDAYADLNDIDGFSRIRVGRQTVYESPEVAFFDGILAASEELGSAKFQFGAYFGASTHLYETSHSGDLTAGAYAQMRPWTGGRVRVDYMYLEDDARLGSHEDDLFGAGFWQNCGKNLDFDAAYSRVADRDRDAQGRLVYRVPEWDLMLRGSYYRLLQTQGDLVLEADPYYNALNELHPYDQWSLLAAKDFAEMVRLQGAADLRRVDDNDDIGTFNRDYDHYYATASLFEFGCKGLTVSATMDLWNSDGQNIDSWGADASYVVDRTTFSAGTYYSLYKYDLFSNSERDDVRTYYLRLRHKMDAITLDGDYEFEDEDLDRFHRVRLGVTWRF